MFLESLITGVGSGVAKGVFRVWLKDQALLLGVGEEFTDVLKEAIPDIRKRRSTQRQFEQIADRAAESVLQMLEKEGKDISDERLDIVISAAGATILTTNITAELAASESLSPDRLLRYFLNKKGSEGGNPGKEFSDEESQIYSRILHHASQLIVDISSQLPRFQEAVFSEILSRQTVLIDKANEVVSGIDKILKSQEGESIAHKRFESDYRIACIRKYDRLQLFGVDVQNSHRRYQLSVAYVALEVELSKRMRMEQALSATTRLFLRGAAGSGKTTLLQWFATKAAGRELNGTLAEFNGSVPFLIKLRDLRSDSFPSLEDWPYKVTDALSGKPSDWVHGIVSDGRAIILIDGVDEVSEYNRGRVLDWIDHLTSLYPRNYFVVTARPHAVPAQWLERAGFTVAEVKEMGRDDIVQFIDHWHKAILLNCQDDREKKDIEKFSHALKVKITNDVSLYRLVSNPLLNAIICALHRERVENLPSDRIELYRACVDMFFRRNRERKVNMEDYVELTDRQLLFLLQDLAWWMIRNAKTTATRLEVEDRFNRTMLSLAECPIDADGKQLCKLFVERVGILRELSPTNIDFPHRTFQEYLAAYAAVTENDLGSLISNAHDPQWREVVIIAAALIADVKKAEKFILLLLEKGDKGWHREILYIVAAASLESVVHLPHIRRVQTLVEKRLEKIVPPKSISGANELAKSGDLVVSLLRYNEDWDVESSCASIRSLSIIGTETATYCLIGWTADRRPEIHKQISLSLRDSQARTVSRVCKDWKNPQHVKELDLSTIPMDNFAFLEKFVNLEVLNLAYTTINNIDALQSLKSLRILNLEGTKVDDISALRELSLVEDLNLALTLVSDIEVLGDKEQLTTLNLMNTNVESVAALTGCRALRELSVLGVRVDRKEIVKLRRENKKVRIIGRESQ